MAPVSPTPATAAELAVLHTRFLRFLRGKVRDTATAEDILQSAYLKAIQHGGALRDAETSVAWFYRILRNAVADHYRRSATHAKAMDKFAAEWQEGYEPLLHEQACTCIREAVRTLKPGDRAAIEQVDLAGHSIGSFAGATGTTLNTAYVRLHRARKAVAQRLIAICGTCAEHQCIDCSCKKPRRTALHSSTSPPAR